MVVFTCNSCGESLQKPKVEKHFLISACKKAKSLTCVDCFKDFLNEDYVAHTKCITEEERYAAKGSFPKGVVKKGEIKQHSWTEVIKSVVENSSDVNDSQKQIFNVMSVAVNVPRKKNKFMNFIKSAMGNKVNARDVEAIWDLIEKQKAVQSETNQEPTKSALNINCEEKSKAEKKKKKSKTVENEVGDDPEVSPISNSEDSNKKKKNKRKLENGALNTDGLENAASKNHDKPVEESLEINKENLGKKKRKQKNLENDKEEIQNLVLGKKEEKFENNDLEKLNKNTKKTKIQNEDDKAVIEDKAVMTESPKKKSKKLQEETHIGKNDILNETDTTQVNNVMDGSKKKKKSKTIAKDDAVNLNISTDDAEKKKKKKKKCNTAEDGNNKVDSKKSKITDENGIVESKKRKLQEYTNDVANGESEKKKIRDGVDSGCDFSYNEKILEIVKAKNSISLDKLQKKVLGAYQKAIGSVPTAGVIKKFKKHLKKISAVEVCDGTVKLVAQDH